jgi:glutamyl-tRNA reductase
MLNKLFQAAFSAAKRVRSQTHIGANAVSLAGATVSLARRVYSDLSAHTALMVGAGEMNALTARHFASADVKRLVIANRTVSRAQLLASELKGHAVGLDDLDRQLCEADIVIACTGSPQPLISKRASQAAIRARRRRPIFMVDMSVPRNIEPAVAELEDVYLFTIDDLQQLVDENLQQRAAAADAAKLLIEQEVARFLAETRVQDAGPAIRLMREQAEAIRQQTLDQARRMLSAGRPQGEVIEYLANTLMNRLLHGPTQALRQAAELADKELAEAVARLLTEERNRH